MAEPSLYFSSIEEIEKHLKAQDGGNILVEYRNVNDYPGMVLAMMITYIPTHSTYGLDLQWMSLGLDLYGDTLQESYLYAFHQLADVIAYLEKTYGIKATDIPLKYQFDKEKFPDPIKDFLSKPEFEAAWEQFQQDFRQGLFLDRSLSVIYDSSEQ